MGRPPTGGVTLPLLRGDAYPRTSPRRRRRNGARHFPTSSTQRRRRVASPSRTARHTQKLQVAVEGKLRRRFSRPSREPPSRRNLSLSPVRARLRTVCGARFVPIPGRRAIRSCARPRRRRRQRAARGDSPSARASAAHPRIRRVCPPRSTSSGQCLKALSQSERRYRTVVTLSI